MSKTPSRKYPYKFVLAAALLASFAAVALRPGVARAEAGDEDPVAKITQLNREAVTAYQAGKFEDARKLLKQALDVAGENGLDQHPIKARTHIHMGIVIIAGFHQRDVGIKQFKKALEIQGDIALTKGLVTPDLQAAFDEAKGVAPTPPPEQVAAPPPPAAAPAAPAAPEVPSAGLVHEAVTVGKRGSAISISVGVQSDLRFDKLVLAYRPEGASEFLGREMKQVSESTYAAEIPTTATAGVTVAYYVEAEDKDGAPLAARGSADNPMVISLGGAAHPVAVVSKTEEEEGDEEEEGSLKSKVFLGLLIGSGAGWATGTGDTNADVKINPPGFALAELGHFAPEIGYWLTSNFMLSLQGRFQTITGTTDVYSGSAGAPGMQGKVFHTANYAAAGFAKATYRFGSTGTWHPFVSGAVGYGRIRHVVTFNRLKCGQNNNETCVDTIGAGPVALGPGAGVTMDINEHFVLVGQLNSQLAFPDFTFNADLNLGVAMVF
jgi:hypothetical protein